MDMQEARNTLVSAVMNNAGALQKALTLLGDKDPALSKALKEVLEASEHYVFARTAKR
jgi:hypothetical protein